MTSAIFPKIHDFSRPAKCIFKFHDFSWLFMTVWTLSTPIIASSATGNFTNSVQTITYPSGYVQYLLRSSSKFTYICGILPAIWFMTTGACLKVILEKSYYKTHTSIATAVVWRRSELNGWMLYFLNSFKRWYLMVWFWRFWMLLKHVQLDAKIRNWSCRHHFK